MNGAEFVVPLLSYMMVMVMIMVDVLKGEGNKTNKSQDFKCKDKVGLTNELFLR